jgi:hypothetical protein
MVEKMSKPFSFRFRIWCSKFRTKFEFVRKYEFDRIKCRKRCGSVRDISVPFSSLEVCFAFFCIINTVQMIHVRPLMNMYGRLDLYWFFFYIRLVLIEVDKLSCQNCYLWVDWSFEWKEKIKRRLNIHETPIKAGVNPGFYFYGSYVQPPFSRR